MIGTYVPTEVETDAWVLSVPDSIDEHSPLLVVPTVHPRGDRRVVRCAQVALEAGFRVHLVWLGSGSVSEHRFVQETLFPAPQSTVGRIRLTRSVAKKATSLGGALWHIHDFYMLPFARCWTRRTGRKAVYDVHEYYGEYYAGKLPLPGKARTLVAELVEKYHVRVARAIGAANVVAEPMAARFTRAGVPTSVSPNYPLLSQRIGISSAPFSERCHSVLHVGTLSRAYGTELLVRLAARSKERSLPFRFRVVERYSDDLQRMDFNTLLSEYDTAGVLELVAPVPAHRIPRLFATAGFGLSLLSEADPQAGVAVPAKNYEAVLQSVVGVVTPATGQASFWSQNGVCSWLREDDLDEALDRMLLLAAEAPSTERALEQCRLAASKSLTWESGSAPGLARMYRLLLPKDS